MSSFASLILDFKHGLRILARSPGFAVMAILTLALGVGAATAIFSVVNGVLLKPLPFRAPAELVQIFETNQRSNEFATSEATFLDMRAQSQSLADVAAVRYDSRNVDSASVGAGDPEQIPVGAVSASFFSLLGVQPALGTGFGADDDAAGHPSSRIVLTDALWHARFAGNRDIIGKTIRLDGQSYVIAGVMPPHFDFPDKMRAYIPLGADPSHSRSQHILSAMGRLKPGVTLTQASADMSALALRLGQEYPESNRNWGIRLASMQEILVGPTVARTVWVLWAAVMLLLAMACVNVANLIMARATTRQHEITVRVALGASRRRILSQLLAESLPLSLAGGALGVLFASLGVDLLRRLGTENVPRLDEIAIDGRVLAFAGITAVASALVFGLLPLLQLSSSELRPAIGSGARHTQGRAGRRTIDGLVATQMALALVLLVGAGLMMRSFFALTRVDPGFRSDHVLEVGVALSPAAYKPPQMIQLYHAIDQELGALPGVDAVGAMSIAPESDGNTYTRFLVSDRPQRDDEFLMANWRSPTAGVFRALGIPLLRGRMLTDADYSLDSRAALVNATAAKRFWPDADPIGKTITPYARKDLHYTVVGVVGDVRDVALATPPDAAVYLSGRNWQSMTFMLHTAGDPMALAAAARERVHEVNPNIPVTLTTLDATLSTSIAQPRFAGTMLAIFSWVALTLAMMGIFSVISFSVAQQTREIGIRMALGAQPGDVLRMVLRRGLVLTVIGLAVGVAGALACTRLLASLLYAVGATDPLVFAGVTLLIALVALGASWLAARRATAVDPMIALRAD
ncbi:MAG TPA: ABC transporter permease [Polyangia bacterium]|nr:ABC transporter permease [Polyangia bacterium]